MANIEGSCHCGTIKLRILGGFGENTRAIVCHCSVCATLAGSLFAYVAQVSRVNFQVLQGTTKAYKQPKSEGMSGQITRHFCGDCGTPLWAESEAMPDGISVKLAPFGNKLPPGAEIFWKNAHKWQKPMVVSEAVFDGMLIWEGGYQVGAVATSLMD
ncbi:hypothetical protein DAEQUDRAFT_445084 [Daedalea quercina L-15889]|uniref:CENP-V/GFA domain-containing protein n=1 Tax=Daedalea quercina L-15889 TaxID=1314783 RepID=A0A165N7C7_9APHY|nr:hypothetical protein DAEQUDRAFT_445084 [Daedalea quercina L-15889]